MELSIIQSDLITDYKAILEGLTGDFDYEYYRDILIWCDILDNTDTDKYWQVYLIMLDNEIVGICGLYSLYPRPSKELWLSWFGVIPSKRNRGIGQYALDWMKNTAKVIGCKKLMSYVEEDGQALPFYYRNGFELVGTVEYYLVVHPELSLDSFGDKGYYIIECYL